MRHSSFDMLYLLYTLILIDHHFTTDNKSQSIAIINHDIIIVPSHVMQIVGHAVRTAKLLKEHDVNRNLSVISCMFKENALTNNIFGPSNGGSSKENSYCSN